MKRRDSLKAIALTALASGTVFQSCNTENKTGIPAAPRTSDIDRHPFELERDEKLMAQKFFNEHEMNTIKVLIDIIIPKDGTSGSATDAGVHNFIAFIVNDMPRHQVPLRGGLKWLDIQCLNRYSATFIACSSQDQLALVDEIAYPAQAKPDMQQGVKFFNLLRDLTATGFYTSEMGLKDLGYVGNTPNRWDGVPQEVLDQYGLRYDEKTLNESISWDDES